MLRVFAGFVSFLIVVSGHLGNGEPCVSSSDRELGDPPKGVGFNVQINFFVMWAHLSMHP